MVPGYGFDEALVELKLGTKMQRIGWNGNGMRIALQSPDENSKMQQPYIFMSTADGTLVPWVASQTDLLAMDWQAYNTAAAHSRKGNVR